VYWYDSDGIREEEKEDCGTSSYTGSNYCSDDGDVHKDYVTVGCSGSSCTESTSPIEQEDCKYGCSTNSCDPPDIVNFINDLLERYGFLLAPVIIYFLYLFLANFSL